MKKNKDLYKIERVISDLKRGLPVFLSDKNALLAVAENISNELYEFLKKNCAKTEFVVSGYRLGLKSSAFKKIDAKNLTLEKIHKIIGAIEAQNSVGKINSKPALEFSKMAGLMARLEILPALIMFSSQEEKIKKIVNAQGFLEIKSSEMNNYIERADDDFRQVSKAPLLLEDAKRCELIAFRNRVEKEHYAIIIGRLGRVPLVRIHSSCYTGDLLGSLRCDCRDQLHETIKFMAKNDGGIILYLMQEGRGIGLANKLRAYDLQINHKFDTVDANRVLGFNDDERLFLPAVKILKLLKINKVRLISNNPRKAEDIIKMGIKVEKTIPIIAGHNQHNSAYLLTKLQKMRHKL